MGIEPTFRAWEAFVLPLNYARLAQSCGSHYSGFVCAAVVFMCVLSGALLADFVAFVKTTRWWFFDGDVQGFSYDG